MSDLKGLTEDEKASLVLKLRDELLEAESRAAEREALLKIYRMWVKHREKMFPDACRGRNIRGIDLDFIRQNFSGCVCFFLTRGGLTGEQRECLYACDDDLGVVALELQGYEGFYFRQMKSLTSAVIEYLRSYAA